MGLKLNQEWWKSITKGDPALGNHELHELHLIHRAEATGFVQRRVVQDSARNWLFGLEKGPTKRRVWFKNLKIDGHNMAQHTLMSIAQ